MDQGIQSVYRKLNVIIIDFVYGYHTVNKNKNQYLPKPLYGRLALIHEHNNDFFEISFEVRCNNKNCNLNGIRFYNKYYIYYCD